MMAPPADFSRTPPALRGRMRKYTAPPETPCISDLIAAAPGEMLNQIRQFIALNFDF
jgi:hypothetical protein